ncbi:MAG: alpha/beta hydrolase [Bacteroidetes bacterium]|nr:alpha/beta hydrolase [Bacteroidota bacterium]
MFQCFTILKPRILLVYPLFALCGLYFIPSGVHFLLAIPNGKLTFKFQNAGGFKFVDLNNASQRPPVLFLHGLLGNPEGWFDAAAALATRKCRAIVPYLPIDHMPRGQANVGGLVNYVREFTDFLDIDSMVLVGNSLGGQIALRYSIDYPEHIAALILSGSSGIYETEIGTKTFRRQDRVFIRAKAEKSFYDPAMVTDELIDRIHELATDRFRALRIVWVARSSVNDLVIDDLGEIKAPTLLIWGAEDQITPPDVAHTFDRMMPSTQLHFIEKCGHAPMMEHPDTFNEIMIDFLEHSIDRITLPSVPI